MTLTVSESEFETESVSSFFPPRRTLMGPGPSDVYPRVLNALSRPTIGHLDPLFVGMMDELKALLQYAFQTRNAMTLAVSGPGSAGMEACFVNLLEPGDKVVVCRNGVFGGRMIENAQRCGARVVVVDDPWGRAVSPEKLQQTLSDHPDTKLVAFVHAETSTGVLSDAETLCQIAGEHGCLTLVDTVTSLGGVPVQVDDWGIDAVYSGSQKCLSCVPGLSPVSFSPRAVEVIQQRKTPVQSWFLDQSLVMGYWSGDGSRTYHHTAPVNALYAQHEALVVLRQTGLETLWQQHKAMHRLLADGLEAQGIRFVVPEAERLPQLNVVQIPDGIDDVAVRRYLLTHFDLEIGAGLGEFAGKAWRIGLMGYGARAQNVTLLLAALAQAVAQAQTK